MRNLILLFLATFLVCSCSESEQSIAKEQRVVAYIRSQDRYIAATDGPNAQKILEKDYQKVLTYMKENGMNADNYYFVDGSFAVSEDAKYIMIPVRHYESMKKEMEQNLPDGAAQKKNTSGKDGFLLLEFMSNKVVGFQNW